MNRYILNDFGFFSTKMFVAYLDFAVMEMNQTTYFGLPNNISNEVARRKICEFISQNLENYLLDLIARKLLSYLIQYEDGSQLVFFEHHDANEIMTQLLNQINPQKSLSQINPQKSLYDFYFEPNGQTKLEKMLIDILRKDSDRFLKKLFEWDKLIIKPLVLNNYYNLC